MWWWGVHWTWAFPSPLCAPSSQRRRSGAGKWKHSGTYDRTWWRRWDCTAPHGGGNLVGGSSEHESACSSRLRCRGGASPTSLTHPLAQSLPLAVCCGDCVTVHARVAHRFNTSTLQCASMAFHVLVSSPTCGSLSLSPSILRSIAIDCPRAIPLSISHGKSDRSRASGLRRRFVCFSAGVGGGSRS